MKAAVCREFGKPLVIEDLVLDPPEAGEVRVRVKACAICHSDIIFIDGGWGGTLPAVYGHEAAGIVEEIGPGVTGAAVGDAVVVSLLRWCGTCFHCTHGETHLCERAFPLDLNGRLHDRSGAPVKQGLRTGAFAEEIVVHESQVARVPDPMPFDSASLLACGVITGLGAVFNTAHVRAGSSVVVIGAGGVGINAIQGATLAGARSVIAVDLLDVKLEAARAFGATHVLNARDPNAANTIRTICGGRGADYVFVTVGSSRAVEEAFAFLRPAGTLVFVGMPATGDTSRIEVGEVANLGQRILGSKMGSTRLQADIPKLVDLYDQGRLRLDELITARYPIEEINAAVASTRSGAALRNVIIFD